MNIEPSRKTDAYRRQRCQPTPELNPFIDNYQMLESTSGGILPRIMPGAGAACFFMYGAPLAISNLHDAVLETRATSFLICNRHQVLELSAASATGFIVVHFRPGRLRYFTDASFSELQDRITPADELWGLHTSGMSEQLSNARNLAERAALLSAFFIRLLQERSESRLDLLLDLLYLSPGTKIATLAEQSGLSLRHFERVFANTYGVTPKYFARVSRMQQVARKLALDPGVSTLESALDAGFFDQSHFIHELNKLAGLSPSDLAQGVRERPHFYNPKALQWYISHVQKMVGQQTEEQRQSTQLLRDWLARRIR